MLTISVVLILTLTAVLMASNIYRSISGGPPGQLGTLTLTQTGAPQVVWNLTFLEISFSGATIGPNSKVTIYDGDPPSAPILFQAWLTGPTSSVGFVQKIDIPNDSSGLPSLQASPGNDMTILVNGFGNNACIINARFTDGIPSGRPG